MGELGDGSTANSSVPVAVDTSGVLAGKTLTQISAGSGDTCALDSAGAAYCWGCNMRRRTRRRQHRPTPACRWPWTPAACWPARPSPRSGRRQGHVRAGQRRRRLLLGRQRRGELGDGSTTTPASRWPSTPAACWPARPSPRSAPARKPRARWTAPAPPTAGAATTTASSATAAPADSSVPVAVDTSGVLAGKTLTQISAGVDHHVCAGQRRRRLLLGLQPMANSATAAPASSSVPVAVDTSGVLAGKTLTQISAGDASACALDSAGAAYCWGVNGDGELGDGSTTRLQRPGGRGHQRRAGRQDPHPDHAPAASTRVRAG